MIPPVAIPPLRPLEAFPVQNGDREVIALRDPTGIVGDVLAIAPEIYLVATHFDGAADAAGVAAAASARLGAKVSVEVVERIAALLSERLLLDDVRFQARDREAREEFARLPTRAPAHAGAAYPTEAGELRQRLGGILACAWDQPRPDGTVVGLIAPHIDLDRGEHTYARSYGALRDSGPIDRVVVLGTCHAPTASLLSPTRKPFETPLGTVDTDLDAVERVIDELGGDACRDEFTHRGEHSIEFQALFLRLIHPEAKIVPLLCGSLRTVVEDGTDPSGNDEVERAVSAVRAAFAPKDGKRTVVIAGADLAHIGPRFGGPALTREMLDETEKMDRAALDLAAARDAAGWHRTVSLGGDPRNTCGLSPVYLLLRALDSGDGHLVAYRQCASADQCVTIGGMAFVDGAAR